MNANDVKHTPGPWLKMRANGPAPRWTVEAPASGVRIAVDYGDGPAGQSEANMTLIAAAPDLLAALERLVKSDLEVCTCRPWGHGGPVGGGGSRSPITKQWMAGAHADDCPHEAARAAIAKARGEA